MRISELIKNLQYIQKRNGDLHLIYAKDSEGNSFEEIYLSPTTGNFQDGDFIVEVEGDDELIINACCIN